MRTIESEIIPRLMLAHRAVKPAPPAAPLQAAPTSETVLEFTGLIAGHPLPMARAYVDALLAQGTSLETIFLELLAPCARHLGELWMNDLCTFTDVSVGLSRLQQLVHELGPSFSAQPDDAGGERLVVLIPAPGEQHTLGLHIVGEFFRKAGWNVRAELSTNETDLVALVRSEYVDMVGFSVSNIALVEPLQRLIKSIRAHSLNRELVVMLGGALNMEEHITRTGATAFGANAREAVQYMERHLQGSARQRPH